MTAARRSRQILSGIGLWIVPAVLGALLARTPLPQIVNLQNFLFDYYQTLSPRPWSPELPVRIVDIDDASLARYGRQWPWPRTLLARLNDKLNAEKPLAIVYDIVFAEPDRLSPQQIIASLPDLPERQRLADALGPDAGDNDSVFAQSLGRSRSVLGYTLTQRDSDARLSLKSGISNAGDDPAPFVPAFGSAELPIPKLADQAKGLGAFNYTPDRDLIVRRIPLVFHFKNAAADEVVPSLDAEALRVALLEDDPQDPSAPLSGPTLLIKSSNGSGGTLGTHTGIRTVQFGNEVIQTESDGAVRVRFAGRQPGRFIPAWKVLEGNFDPQEIQGRIILVGTSAAALGDLRSTPLQPAVPGVEIHAELLEHILTGAELARPDYMPGLEAILSFLGALLLGLLARHLRALLSALAAIAFIGATFGLSYWAFASANLLLDPLIPASTGFAAWGLTSVARYRQTERARRAVYELMGRYVSPAVAARLASDPSMLKLGGETRYVTVLFCDIRDFTARSEILSASEIIEFLNALYGPLSDIVTESGGTIDKFIGDAVMAYWNAPLPMPEHAEVACRAALAMQAAVPRIDLAEAEKARLRGHRHIPVRVGIGVNVGEVVMGNVGSERRRNFSIIGDPVNVAARLESATKQFGVNILVSESVTKGAPQFRFTPLGEADLRGKSSAVRVFSLDGPV